MTLPLPRQRLHQRVERHVQRAEEPRIALCTRALDASAAVEMVLVITTLYCCGGLVRARWLPGPRELRKQFPGLDLVIYNEHLKFGRVQ